MVSDQTRAGGMRPALAAGFAVLVLAGCATPQPRIVTQEVQVPVAVSCAPPGLKLSDGYPDTAEALKGAPNLAERVKLLLEGRALRDADLVQLRPLLKACGGE